MKDITKESLAQWIAELESQPHLSLREERYLAVMKYAAEVAEHERDCHLDRAEYFKARVNL